MTRFFVNPAQIVNGHVDLAADDAFHLHTVLKAKNGDAVAVLDGLGNEFDAVLIELGKTRARARITSARTLTSECSTTVTVAQALPKMSEKIEQVLQHGTEVGAAGFWGFSSARSQTHLTGERQEKRLRRWAQIVKTAAEQSHRAILPEVCAEHDFDGIVAAAPAFDLALLAYEAEAGKSLRAALEALANKPRTLLLIIGPEGGFTEAEVRKAQRSGVTSISLGARILRTETAALVALSQIVYALE